MNTPTPYTDGILAKIRTLERTMDPSLAEAVSQGDVKVSVYKNLNEEYENLCGIGNVGTILAAKEGYTEVVKYLLGDEFSIDEASLLVACARNNLCSVKILLERTGIDIVYRGVSFFSRGWYNGSSPLEFAAGSGSMDVAKYIVDLMDKVSEDDFRRIYPGMFSGKDNSTDTERYHSAKQESLKYVIEDAFDYAVIGDHMEMVEYLLSLVEDTQPLLSSGVFLVGYTGNKPMLDYFLSRGVDLEYVNAIDGAVWGRNHDMARYIISKGFYFGGSEGMALSNAAENEDLEMVKILVEAGAPVHGYPWQSENGDKDYPLAKALEKKNVPIISYLLSKGAVINPQKEDLLTEFSRIGDLDQVKYILEEGADPRAMDFSALTAAVRSGNIEVFKALSGELNKDKYGSALRHVDADKLLITAVRSGKLEMLKHIASITVRKEHPPDAVKEAIRRKDVKMVEFLLPISYFDKSLMYDAIASGSVEIVELLVKKGIYADGHVKTAITSRVPGMVRAFPVQSMWVLGRDDFRDACKVCTVEEVDYLLTAKPEFKEYINSGFVAAADRSNIGVMKYLISKGANAHTKSNEIIEEAAKEGRYSVVAYLLTLYDEERIGKLKLRRPLPERPFRIPI